jgi:hypothetical protein
MQGGAAIRLSPFMAAAPFLKQQSFAGVGFCVMDTTALIVCYRRECIEFLPS